MGCASGNFQVPSRIDFRGTVLPHSLVPTGRRYQAVGCVFGATAELDRVRPVSCRRRREAVDRVRVEVVLLEVALRVVDADRPEAVHRHGLDRQLVHRLAVVGLGIDGVVDGILLRVQARARRRGLEMADRIDRLPVTFRKDFTPRLLF